MDDKHPADSAGGGDQAAATGIVATPLDATVVDVEAEGAKGKVVDDAILSDGKSERQRETKAEEEKHIAFVGEEEHSAVGDVEAEAAKGNVVDDAILRDGKSKEQSETKAKEERHIAFVGEEKQSAVGDTIPRVNDGLPGLAAAVSGSSTSHLGSVEGLHGGSLPTESSSSHAAALQSNSNLDRDTQLELQTSQSDNSSNALANLDVDSSDTDSALGAMDTLSSTQSARSSIYDFIEENGRKYHRFREGRYMLPNDEIEQDRLDLQHHLFLLTFSGRLALAPISSIPNGVHRVLDVATGTGIWAIDFAHENPATSVVGMDLSPIQPAFVPPNCRFEVDDADDEWIYSQPFDYIHGRALTTCFKSTQHVFRQAFKSLRPGGYLELQDMEMPFKCLDDSWEGTELQGWMNLVMKGGEALGRDFAQVPRYKSYMEEAGFVDVVEKRYVWPIGTWPRGEKMKILGSWAREDMMSVIPAISMAIMTRGLGMSAEEVELLLVGPRKELNSNKVHIYVAIYVVYGRKPL